MANEARSSARLGLAIVDRSSVCPAGGGRRQPSGGGTTFTVSLPKDPRAAVESPPPTLATEPVGPVDVSIRQEVADSSPSAAS
jgi:hypothetical protein